MPTFALLYQIWRWFIININIEIVVLLGPLIIKRGWSFSIGCVLKGAINVLRFGNYYVSHHQILLFVLLHKTDLRRAVQFTFLLFYSFRLNKHTFSHNKFLKFKWYIFWVWKTHFFKVLWKVLILDNFNLPKFTFRLPFLITPHIWYHLIFPHFFRSSLFDWMNTNMSIPTSSHALKNAIDGFV